MRGPLRLLAFPHVGCFTQRLLYNTIYYTFYSFTFFLSLPPRRTPGSAELLFFSKREFWTEAGAGGWGSGRGSELG